jgi:hypothetical protein
MSDGSEKMLSVAHARRLLRNTQREWARGMEPATGNEALELARQRTAERIAEARQEGEYVRVGVFRYLADIERARWDRTAEIVERVQPGPFEDGGYLEFLAYQAASVEMYLATADLDPSVEPALHRIIFGTTGEPTSQASTRQVGDAAFIVMSAGMVSLMYQMAKAVTLSWMPKPAPKGAAISLSGDLQDTRTVIDRDPTSVNIVADTLLGWLYNGFPRPPDSMEPPPIYQPSLGLLTNYSERFVIAHEYGHGLVDQFGIALPWVNDAQNMSGIDKEFRADVIASIVVAASAGELDGVAPNIALQGAVLAMKAHEIADRAIDLARGGDGAPSWRSTTHPPFEARAQLVEEVYRSLTQGVEDSRLDVAGMRVPADTAELLWERVSPRLRTELRTGRRLHPIWNRA